MIKQQDVPLVSTVAATLLAGRIDGMTDSDRCISDAVYLAECIIAKAQTRVEVHAQRRTIHQGRQHQEGIRCS